MLKKYITVFCTCPNLKIAESLAELLVKNHLAACVNIISSVHSIFYWEEKLEKINEAMLIIKTAKTCYKDLEVMIQKNHPYKVPEIISIPIEEGQKDYLNFIQQNVKSLG